MKLGGFLGINFGVTKENVIEVIKSRPGCILDEENSDDRTLFFEGLKFAGRDTLFIIFKFYENKFSKASVFIKPKLEAQTISWYLEIKKEINEKYFVSTEDYEIYQSPYEKDDEYTETAIAIGKATFSCYWSFNNDNGVDDCIALSINEDMNIIISYEDGYLMDLLVKKNNEQNSLDY